MIVRIKNLRLRVIIGINKWEREKKQDIIINIALNVDGSVAEKTDNINDTLDYKLITKKIILNIEETKFFLLERLADFIIDQVMENNKVLSATVDINKPHALRFADSVSVEVSRKR